MPVYLCCPGQDAAEPWRHGIQVFSAPFDLSNDPNANHTSNNSNYAAATATNHTASAEEGQQQPQQLMHRHQQQQQLLLFQQQRLMDHATGIEPTHQTLMMVHAAATTTTSAVTATNHTNAAAAAGQQQVPPGPLPPPPPPPQAQAQEEEEEDDALPGEMMRFQPRAYVPTIGGGGGGGADNRSGTMIVQQQQHPQNHPSRGSGTINNNSNNNSVNNNMPIRRVRHAEIVLVDDVCTAHGRYWLRLRWPGRKGGFAGYIAMGLVNTNNNNNTTVSAPLAVGGGGGVVPAEPMATTDATENPIKNNSDLDGTGVRSSELSAEKHVDDHEDEDPAREREETSSMPPSEPFVGEENRSMMCRRTGIAFQSTSVLKLLALYDDGVVPSSALPPFPTEPVFCRICREGLHDDADEEQPAAAADEGEPTQREKSRRRDNPRNNNNVDDYQDDDEPIPSEPTEQVTKGPVQPHPAYSPNADALQNPMLAPCECAGSMAFVHYLCVEQWRCRSRHPEAANGLNCETCGTAYSLPPPSERPMQVPEQEDWLDAMPPHVMQALRQPHIWWQIGAAIVRRRWLRPVAPVLMSPIVALYCRARRLLKKRGVARRRWACSLCRRRARWKCVRCLRSYYCSRQCQNVSWHIIHKHVCYKPVRFWWSVVVYGALTLALFPGILRDPLMYDIGVCLIPASFVIMGILGGGIATVVKNAASVDMRGRLMELAVVLATLWLSVISWGLVKGFFGNAAACYGTVGSYNVTAEDVSSTYVLRGLRLLLLQPAEKIYLAWDRIFMNSLFRSALCTNAAAAGGGVVGCFEHLPHTNADFILIEAGGEKCAADLMLFFTLYLTAGLTFAGSALWKHHERQRRRQGRQRPVRGGPPHLHQD